MAATTSNLINEEILALTPHCIEWDIANLIAFRQEKNAKFEPVDFFNRGHIAHEIARDYARHYSGTFEFMRDMKEKERRGQLTPQRTASIINCWYNDLRGLQIRAEQAARQAKQEEPIDEGSVVASQAVVPDGYYTFSFTAGDHLTLRVRVKASEPGVQRVAVLIGPDNENDYQPFGFLKGARYIPFSAYRQGYDRWHAAARALVGLDEEGRKEAGLLYAQQSGNCMKCGRLLTDPVSIALGIGPVCRGENHDLSGNSET